MKFVKVLEESPYIISLLIISFLIYWFGESPKINSTEAIKIESTNEVVVEKKLPKVTTQILTSTEIYNTINSYGTTKAFQEAFIQPKLSGEIVKIYKKKGENVDENEVIAKINSDVAEAELKSLKQSLKEVQLKLKINKELYDEDFSSKVDIAAILTKYEQIKAGIQNLEDAIKNSYIISPIKGELGDFELNIGDFVQAGKMIAKVYDLSKISVDVDIPESYQSHISKNSSAYIEMPNGEIINGTIGFVSNIADPTTHTFRVEVIAEEGHRKYVGSSASVFVLTEKSKVYNVSPAFLSLNPKNKEKNMGLKIVEDGKVKFMPVEIIKSSQKGLWVKAPKDTIELIVLGKSYVVDGQEVEHKIIKNNTNNKD